MATKTKEYQKEYKENKQFFEDFHACFQAVVLDKLGIFPPVEEDTEDYLQLLEKIGEPLPEGAQEVRKYFPSLKNIPDGVKSSYAKTVVAARKRKKTIERMIKNKMGELPFIKVGYGKFDSSKFNLKKFEVDIDEALNGLRSRSLVIGEETLPFFISNSITERKSSLIINRDKWHAPFIVVANANSWFIKKIGSDNPADLENIEGTCFFRKIHILWTKDKGVVENTNQEIEDYWQKNIELVIEFFALPLSSGTTLVTATYGILGLEYLKKISTGWLGRTPFDFFQRPFMASPKGLEFF